jgi:hypothetical protein
LRAGSPHSDIYGSKLYCQLPVAFRRLTRLSSPVIAKASITCTYSLDPITLSPHSLRSKATLQVFFRLAFVTRSVRLARIGFDTIKNPHAFHTLVMNTICVRISPCMNHVFTLLLQIFKEQLKTVSQQKLISKPLDPWTGFKYKFLSRLIDHMNGGG